MYMRYCSSSVKVNNYFLLSITLWSMNCFSSSRPQWKLFSDNLSNLVSTNSKLSSNWFYWSPCAWNTLNIKLSILMSSLLTNISMVKLYPYYPDGLSLWFNCIFLITLPAPLSCHLQFVHLLLFLFFHLLLIEGLKLFV